MVCFHHSPSLVHQVNAGVIDTYISHELNDNQCHSSVSSSFGFLSYYGWSVKQTYSFMKQF